MKPLKLLVILILTLSLTSCVGHYEDDGDGYTGDNNNNNNNDNNDNISNNDLTWRNANLTWYESYPDPNSEECLEYNGCDWAGHFAYFSEQKSESWVQANNIAAVHYNDWDDYRGKTIRVKQGSNQVDVKIYDLCSDNDCDGCCTRNSSETGFLLDLEIHTADRLGVYGGVVQWACLDC